MAGAAHGGQIVVSDATAHLLRDGLPDDLTLRDLGLHQLKDLPELEHLHQVQADGLPKVFPPLRSLGAVSRLPMPPTPLVGRRAELRHLTDMLAGSAARLVTLTGPGGSGKTRLALELARARVEDFSDGVHFIPLADTHNAEQMWDAVAEALDVPPSPTHVRARVIGLRALLVMDNLEQISTADRVIAEIMRVAPEVSLIATSRRPLHLPQEHEYPVSPLGVPTDDTLAAAQDSPAVQLFVQHARQVLPDFELTAGNAADVVAVCRGLDGLPLAIEIAGARVKVLTPHALVARLHTGLDMATLFRDVADRQRTLRATIAWSYDLLPAGLRGAFARLGVFDGGADLAAVSTVLDTASDSFGPDSAGADPLDVVTSLVDASLLTVTRDHEGEPRVMLLETVRAFALDRLAAEGTLDVVRARHARYYLSVVKSLGPQLEENPFWQARDTLDAEQNNFRAALHWCLEEEAVTADREDRSELAVHLGAGLCDYWDFTAKYIEARQWLERVVTKAGKVRNTDMGECLMYLARCLNYLGDTEAARRHAQDGVELFRELGDEPRLAQALRPLAVATLKDGDSRAARSMFEEAAEIARRPGDPQHDIVDSFALFESIEDHHDRALALHEEAIALAQAAGDLAAARGYRLSRASELRLIGRTSEARDEVVKLIPGVLGHLMPLELMTTAEEYGAILAELGQYENALRLLGAADAVRERNGYLRPQWIEARMEDAYAASRRACRQRSGTITTKLAASPPSRSFSKLDTPRLRWSRMRPSGGATAGVDQV
jgi:predicted ATPase